MNNNNKITSIPLLLLAGGFLVASMSGCTGAKIQASVGQGELSNKNTHRRAELNVSAPIMEILIPISPSKPDNPILLIEGLGRAVQTVTDGADDARFNVREYFGGIGLSNQHGRLGFMANQTDYVWTLEGYHQLTNLITLRAGVEHRNTHQSLLPQDRIKSTQAHVGAMADMGAGFGVGVSYHTGNLSAERVQDRFMLDLQYRF